MHYVENVVESRILFFRNHEEVLEQDRFGNSVRLSQNYVVFSREKFEGVLYEVRTSALKPLVNTKQVYDKRVYFLFWDFRNLVQRVEGGNFVFVLGLFSDFDSFLLFFIALLGLRLEGLFDDGQKGLAVYES